MNSSTSPQFVSNDRPLRIGVLGAARITPKALLLPAQQLNNVQVMAIAAREPDRARAVAAQYAIAHVHDTYQALIADPQIDAIYNPLPNSLHAAWSMAALRAGKHVLCEKPLAANAIEARRMADVAKETGLVLVEAFHNLYHPLAARMKQIVESGELGALRHIEAHFCTLIRNPKDIRFQWHLAGGGLMDLGCYSLRLLRFLANELPAVTRARAGCASPQIDRWLEADFVYPSGATGRITCSMFSAWLVRISAKVIGEEGEMQVINPVVPHLWNRLRVTGRNGTYSERVAGKSSYFYQLNAFVSAVRGETKILTDGEDGVINMQLIDSIYQKAGLRARQT